MRDAIGVDVSKDYLDVHHVGTEVHRRLANDTSGPRALCKGGRNTMALSSCSKRQGPITGTSNAPGRVGG